MNKERAEKFSFEDKWSLYSKVQCHKISKATKMPIMKNSFENFFHSSSKC